MHQKRWKGNQEIPPVHFQSSGKVLRATLRRRWEVIGVRCPRCCRKRTALLDLARFLGDRRRRHAQLTTQDLHLRYLRFKAQKYVVYLN